MLHSDLVTEYYATCRACGAEARGAYRYLTCFSPVGRAVPPARMDRDDERLLLIPCPREGCGGHGEVPLGRIVRYAGEAA
jgi:hypothetical protein